MWMVLFSKPHSWICRRGQLSHCYYHHLWSTTAATITTTMPLRIHIWPDHFPNQPDSHPKPKPNTVQLTSSQDPNLLFSPIWSAHTSNKVQPNLVKIYCPSVQLFFQLLSGQDSHSIKCFLVRKCIICKPWLRFFFPPWRVKFYTVVPKGRVQLMYRGCIQRPKGQKKRVQLKTSIRYIEKHFHLLRIFQPIQTKNT